MALIEVLLDLMSLDLNVDINSNGTWRGMENGLSLATTRHI